LKRRPIVASIKAQNRCVTAGIGSSNQKMIEFYINEMDKKRQESTKQKI